MAAQDAVYELPWAEDADDRTEVAAPLGRVRRLREGADVTIVAAGWMVQEAMRAAERLADSGIRAGVIDVRTLVPLDRDGLVEAAGAAPALLVVDEDYRDFGMCAEIMATVAERLGPAAPRMRRLAPDVSVPASRPLEEALIPSPGSIADQAKELLTGEVSVHSV